MNLTAFIKWDTKYSDQFRLIKLRLLNTKCVDDNFQILVTMLYEFGHCDHKYLFRFYISARHQVGATNIQNLSPKSKFYHHHSKIATNSIYQHNDFINRIVTRSTHTHKAYLCTLVTRASFQPRQYSDIKMTHMLLSCLFHLFKFFVQKLIAIKNIVVLLKINDFYTGLIKSFWQI